MPGNNIHSNDTIVAARAIAASLRSHAEDFERWIKEAEEEQDAAEKCAKLANLRADMEDWIDFLS